MEHEISIAKGFFLSGLSVSEVNHIVNLPFTTLCSIQNDLKKEGKLK